MCFSVSMIGQLLIWAVIIGAVFAVLNLVIPWALSKIGSSIATEGVGMLMQIFKILIWAAVIIFIIIIIFDLISCLIGMGGGLPRLR